MGCSVDWLAVGSGFIKAAAWVLPGIDPQGWAGLLSISASAIQGTNEEHAPCVFPWTARPSTRRPRETVCPCTDHKGCRDFLSWLPFCRICFEGYLERANWDPPGNRSGIGQAGNVFWLPRGTVVTKGGLCLVSLCLLLSSLEVFSLLTKCRDQR